MPDPISSAEDTPLTPPPAITPNADAAPRSPGSSPSPAPSWMAGVLDTARPGHFVADWHTKVPEAAKWEPYRSAKNLEDLLGMAEKRVSDAQAALRNRHGGAPAAPRPDKSAEPEVWRAWREAQGLPETPEGYGLQRPADFPPELWSDDEAAEFMRLAHEHDLKPDLVQALAEWQQERARNLVSDHQRAQATAIAELQREEADALTKAFGPRLDSTLRQLQSVAQASGAAPGWFDPASPAFAGTGMVQFFAGLLERIPRGEDGTRRAMGLSRGSTGGGQYDLAWARAALRPEHPDYEALTNVEHPMHRELVELRNQAYALAGEG